MTRTALLILAALDWPPRRSRRSRRRSRQAIQAGQAGERYDGYMAVVGNGSPDLRRQVSAINIHRRNLYIQLASRRNVTPELVGMATACQLLSRLAVGEAYMLSDGAWRRRAAGQAVPLPDYCR